ncbi:MAG: hypothetical protein M1835_001692, partial [Candelina submexicana]
LSLSSARGSISTENKHLARDLQCGFPGNSDIYGAGIRVGIYTQALAVGFANYFVLHEARVLRSLNTLFMFTMFVGTLFLSRAPSQTYAVEAFILIQITFIIYFVGVINVSRYGRRAWKFSLERLLITEFTYWGMLIYNLWFWWIGLDRMQKTPCGTFILFLAWKVNLYGWIRRAYKVLSILGLCSQVWTLFGGVFRTFYYLVSKQFRSPLFFIALENSLQGDLALVNNDPATIGDNQVQVCPPEAESRTSRTTSARSQLNSSQGYSEGGHTDNCSNITIPEPSIEGEPISIVQDLIAANDTKLDEAEPAKRSSQAGIVQEEPRAQFLPSFSELYAADIYISDILATGKFEVTSTRRWEISLFKGFLKLYLPRFHIHTSADQPSLKVCITTIKNAVRQGRMNGKALVIGSFEISTLLTYPAHKLPWGLHSALTHDSHQTQDWRTLIIVSEIRRSREKTKSRRLYWVPYATQTVFLSVGLILATELHIRWNHISGVRSMDSVGQLIPMLLGIGGLLKVLWAKVKMVWQGKDECIDEVANKADAVSSAYYHQKEIHEECLRGATRE